VHRRLDRQTEKAKLWKVRGSLRQPVCTPTSRGARRAALEGLAGAD
jgi:hypothetical protein